MYDLISRDGVLKEIRQQKTYAGTMSQQVYSTGFIVSLSILEGVISEIPAVDAEPVRHGRWIHLCDYDSPLDSTWMCSCCKWKLVLNLDDSPANHGFSYCPQCGVKMSEEAKHE